MKHEHFLRSLFEQAKGNRKNSVMGLLKEGPQDHPLGPHNRLNGYFNKPQQPPEDALVGIPDPEDAARNDRVARLHQEIKTLIPRLEKYLPYESDVRLLEYLREIIAMVVDGRY